MKLYRFIGRKEIWKNTGQLYFDPSTETSLTEIRKIANKARKLWDKEDLLYTVRIEALTLGPLTVEKALLIFATADPDHLIEKIEVIKEWKREERTATTT